MSGDGKGNLWPPIVVIALTIPAVIFFNWLMFGREPGGQTIFAEFQDGSGLVKNSNVKIGGVDAGTITDLELTEDDTAMATIKLDEEAGTIGEGATAAARPVNLLGEKYVDLEVGDTSEPMPDETSIPLQRTSTPVELDDVLNILDAPTRARLRILINEAGMGMAGRGADFNAMLEQLPPAIDELRRFVTEIDGENERLALVIEQGDRVLASIARERGDLGRLVDEAGATLEVTASRREQLAETFVQAPGALAELRATLLELGATSDALRPTAADLRSTAGPLTATLEALPGFSDASRGTLLKATEVAPALTRLGRRSTPTIEVLRPTLRRLSKFSKQSDQITRDMDRGTFDRAMGTLHGWANAIKFEDGVSNVFGIEVNGDQTLVEGALSRYMAAYFPSGSGTGARFGSGAPGGGGGGEGDTDGLAPLPPDPDGQPLPPQAPDPGEALPDLPELPELPPLPDLGETRDELIDELKEVAKESGLRLADLRELSTRQLRKLASLGNKQVAAALEDLAGGGDALDGILGRSKLDTTRLFDYLFGS